MKNRLRVFSPFLTVPCLAFLALWAFYAGQEYTFISGARILLFYCSLAFLIPDFRSDLREKRFGHLALRTLAFLLPAWHIVPSSFARFGVVWRVLAISHPFLLLLLFENLRTIPRFAGLRTRFLKMFLRLQSQGRLYSKEDLLPGVIATVMLCLLPGLAFRVALFWNTSGWMDSYGYDIDSWRISKGIVPEGNSYYMPLYQYGLAIVYALFGHYFWVQQLVNLFMAALYIFFLCLTIWNFFRNPGTLFYGGFLLATVIQYPFNYVMTTQIENWYCPLLVLCFYAVSVYWRCPIRRNATILGVTIALVINCRAQSAIMLMILIGVPLLVPPKGRTLSHILWIAMIVGLSLLPWSLRNLCFDGRFSPTSEQSIIQMCVLNHPRVGLYGIRYDIGYGDVLNEYYRNFPEKRERLQRMREDAWKFIFSDKQRLAKAAFWRSLAFWGYVPDEKWRDPSARVDWGFFFQNTLTGSQPFVTCLLVLSFLGIFFFPHRLNMLLGALILGNMAVVFFVGFGESRISWPIFFINILAVLSIVSDPDNGEPENIYSWPAAIISHEHRAKMIVLISVALFFISGIYLFWGNSHLRVPLSADVKVVDSITLDKRLPLCCSEKDLASSTGVIRLRGKISNYLCPATFARKDFLFPNLCSIASDSRFYFFFTTDSLFSNVACSFDETLVNQPVREDDQVEIEGSVIARDFYSGNTYLFIRADKMVREPREIVRDPWF